MVTLSELPEEISEGMRGELCRCMADPPIMAAAATAAHVLATATGRCLRPAFTFRDHSP